MKKMLQLVGLCCFGVVLTSIDVYGVEGTGKRSELPNPGIRRTSSSGLAKETADSFSILKEKIKSFATEHDLVLSDCSLLPGSRTVRITFEDPKGREESTRDPFFSYGPRDSLVICTSRLMRTRLMGFFDANSELIDSNLMHFVDRFEFHWK
jgi:hypothetical protein